MLPSRSSPMMECSVDDSRMLPMNSTAWSAVLTRVGSKNLMPIRASLSVGNGLRTTRNGLQFLLCYAFHGRGRPGRECGCNGGPGEVITLPVSDACFQGRFRGGSGLDPFEDQFRVEVPGQRKDVADDLRFRRVHLEAGAELLAD